MPTKRIEVSEEETSEIASLDLHRAAKFLHTLQRNPFVAFVYDKDNNELVVYTKGSSDVLKGIMAATQEDVDGNTN